MYHTITTNEVRRALERCGVKRPRLKVVQMVASRETTIRLPGNVIVYWQLQYPETKIRAAVTKVIGMTEEESYQVFGEILND